MPIPSKSRFGPYEIICSAGAGGMGEVYRAKDTRLDRVVAVKVLPSDLAQDPERRQRFEREARSISTLSHPHICTLHDIGHQDGVDYLVFEYLEGETLEKKLEKGSLPVQEVLRYAIELADALDKAHRQGIIHRDIKPGNIMLTKSGVKLMDFGLAKLKPEPMPVAPVADALTEMTSGKKLTAEGTLLGTFQYMAPEQLEGREADARTDIFAFGEVLYEIATGRPAFSGRTKASLIAALLSSHPNPITELTPISPPPFPEGDIAKAADGHTVAGVAYQGSARKNALWIYELGSTAARMLAETEGGSYPFWSPDGRSLGFFADGKLKRLSLTGGPLQIICDAPSVRGGTWNNDGVI